MGREEGRSWAKHKAKETRGRELDKNPSLCCHHAKSRRRMGAATRVVKKRCLAMGRLQITAISRQLSQEELVFVLVVWLYIPEVWLSFSLGIMTRWSSSNMCMIFLVLLARKNKALEKCAWL